MADKDYINSMVRKGSSSQGVQEVQAVARQTMDRNGYGPTLHNACAATLSEFMEVSGINVPVTLGAANLARRITERGWNRVEVGDQRAGDVAVAQNNVHIFLVVGLVDRDMMVIADNQAPGPHNRKASGNPQLNHSPVAYFLRAEGAQAAAVGEVEVIHAAPDPARFPQEDEDTQQLREPFDDSGNPTN